MSRQRFVGLGCVALLAVTGLAYFGVFRNEFVEYDDNVYVKNNTFTEAGLSAGSLRYAWTTFETGNWIPLTWLSFQVDAALFGVHPVPFHATNLVLHGCNVLLLFAWLVRVTGSLWRSLVVAMLFGVHPLHVESVAWVAERKDVLSTFWLLVTLLCYERYAARQTVSWFLAVCLAFALGLLSKSMLVTLPVLLLLIDIWLLDRRINSSGIETAAARHPQRTTWELLREKIPLFVLSMFAGVMQIVAASHSTAFSQTTGLSPSERGGNALHSYGWYIARTFWPTDLTVLYPHAMHDLPWRAVAASAALLVGVSIYVGRNGSHRPHLLFGWLWFLISLVPVIGLLQVGSQAHADRYSYMPHIGLLMLIVWEAQHWLNHLPAGRIVARVAAGSAVVACAWLTMLQVQVWRTTGTLWTHAVAVDPDNWYAHMALGYLRLEEGELAGAREHFDVVLKHRPNNKAMLEYLTDIYARHGGRQRDEFRLRYELGRYYFTLRTNELARVQFAKAVTLAPEDVEARYGLGAVLAELGRDHEARTHLEIVLARQPYHAHAHLRLGVVLDRAGQLAEARGHYAKAAQLNPNDEEARNRMADAFRRLPP